jgi:hypothetical protein
MTEFFEKCCQLEDSHCFYAQQSLLGDVTCVYEGHSQKREGIPMRSRHKHRYARNLALNYLNARIDQKALEASDASG